MEAKVEPLLGLYELKYKLNPEGSIYLESPVIRVWCGATHGAKCRHSHNTSLGRCGVYQNLDIKTPNRYRARRLLHPILCSPTHLSRHGARAPSRTGVNGVSAPPPTRDAGTMARDP